MRDGFLVMALTPAVGLGFQHDLSRIAQEKMERNMPKFVIEREIHGAGKLSPGDLEAISRKSCDVLGRMGSQIQWINSFVTDDKIYCVYISPNEEMVRQHAMQGGFPANSIARVRAVIDPTTAE
jgi:hypothetical protein